MVRARSAAEIPVVTPVRASIDTVKPVASQPSLAGTISGRSSSSQRSDGSDRQIRPRASQAMNAMLAGVTNWAAMHRSPSFSRSGSSQTTTIPPRRSWASASSSEPGMSGTALTGGGLYPMPSGRDSAQHYAPPLPIEIPRMSRISLP